jgi:predicted  nucleic acid-binding Zn-ribbon protein
MEQHSPSNSNTIKIGLVVLLGALGLLGYLYYGAQTENADLQKLLTGKVDELSNTKVKLDSISRALDAKIAEVQSLGGSIEELEKIKVQLENDKKKLRSDANFSVKKYDDKIKGYETFLAEKEVELQKLREENGILTSQNQTLQTEKQTVLAENTGLKSTRDSLKTTLIEATTTNEDLKQKINVGSALKAVKVDVSALSSRGKERSGEVKNRKIDQLKVSFILPSNPLTATNNKEIFLRLMDPDGGVINDMNKGGVLKFNNQEIGYSLKQSVLYTNNDQPVDMFFKKDQALKSGKYTAELYSEGFKIGNGSFLVK